MEHIAQILTVIVVGTLVGVEFGVAAFTHPILERLPDDAYRQARATGGRILGTVMPFWYAAAAALLVADAVLVRTLLAGTMADVMGRVLDLDRALVLRQQAGNGANQRRFSRAVTAGDKERLA